MMYKHEDFLEAVDFISKELVNLKPLLSEEFPFEEYTKAYKFIDGNPGKSMKIMINLD